MAVVTDIGHNRLQGISVTFQVLEGGGSFDGSDSITLNTDSDGRVLANYTLGPGDGPENNLVVADFDFIPDDPPRLRAARFLASGLIPGNPLDTVVSGVVLDNSNVPIEGVAMHIEGTDLFVQTDAQGLFRIQPAPVGNIHLIADGNTTTREGVWPKLKFELVSVAGQDNTIGMPIFMLPLDIENGLFVDEENGGTLLLDGVPGFSLTMAPGSANFPDGSKSGVVSVTVVRNDKIPMVPNFGMQPSFIITIQPAGTIFSPPAPITLPNVDGMAPGEVTEMYSFDHDLGSFVSIGTGTVSVDGMTISSDPGFGIIKGGWHCGGNPATSGSVEPVQVKITNPNDEEQNSAIQLTIGETLVILAEGGPTPGSYSWVSSDPEIVEIILPSPAEGEDVDGVVVEAKKGGLVNITVTFTCDSGASESDSILIEVLDGNISFTLHDPGVWPDRNNNKFLHEVDAPDVTAAMIQGQNKTSTGINPETVNDDNFEFKMKQPTEEGEAEEEFSLHNNDTSGYEINQFKDLNGKIGVRIYPLLDGDRVAQKEGTYIFKFWNDDDDNDPFDSSSSNDSGVRDFAGNKLEFIPNTQRPEPFVEIKVTFGKIGEFIKVSEVPEVREISEEDYNE